MLNCRHPGLCAWMGRVCLGVLDTISADSAGLPRSAPDEFQKSRFDRQAADLSLLDHHGRDVLSDRTDVLSQQQTSVLSQQQTSVLSQQQTSVLSQQKTSVLSQHHIVCVSETGQGPDTCNRDGSRQPYSNFSNRPHPPRQNRGAVLMGIAVWRVTEKPKKIKWQWGQYVR